MNQNQQPEKVCQKTKKIKSVQLKNGLCVDLFDASRKVAGDRYLVRLEIKSRIPIRQSWFDETTPMPAPLEHIKQLLGEEVLFFQARERNFIDEQQCRPVMDDLIASFERQALGYMGHRSFPGRYIIRCYTEKAKRRMWDRLRRQQER